MDTDIKGYDLLKELCEKNDNFRNLVNKGLESGLIRYFNDEEWNKINSQNFISYTPRIICL